MAGGILQSNQELSVFEAIDFERISITDGQFLPIRRDGYRGVKTNDGEGKQQLIGRCILKPQVKARQQNELSAIQGEISPA